MLAALQEVQWCNKDGQEKAYINAHLFVVPEQVILTI